MRKEGSKEEEIGDKYERGSFLSYLEFLYIFLFISVSLLVLPTFLPFYSKFDFFNLSFSVSLPSIKNALDFPFSLHIFIYFLCAKLFPSS